MLNNLTKLETTWCYIFEEHSDFILKVLVYKVKGDKAVNLSKAWFNIPIWLVCISKIVCSWLLILYMIFFNDIYGHHKPENVGHWTILVFVLRPPYNQELL